MLYLTRERQHENEMKKKIIRTEVSPGVSEAEAMRGRNDALPLSVPLDV